MGLQHLLLALRSDLRRGRHLTNFLARQASSPDLAAHGDLESVLATLDDDAPETLPERDALLRALLIEHHRSASTPPPSSTWAALLLVAFAPMLHALRGRLRGDAFRPDELDCLVLEGFLEALACCPAGARSVCGRLKVDTHRFVIRAVVREQRRRTAQRELETRAREDSEWVLFEWRAPRNELDDEERDELETLLRTLAADSIAEPRLEVVIATRLRGRSLGELPGATGGHGRRGYERLKRERSRTLVELRDLLRSRLSPTEGELAFDLSTLRAAS